MAERNGRAVEGTEGHSRRADRYPIENAPSTQHSFGFWCPDSLALSDLANSSSATPSTRHKADLHGNSPTLLVKLVSPNDGRLNPEQTSLPALQRAKVALKQYLSAGADFAPRGHLSVPGDVPEGEGSATGI